MMRQWLAGNPGRKAEGQTVAWGYGGITQEAGSIIVLNAINNSLMEGKTAFVEGNATSQFTPADLKILAIQENMSAKENPWQPYQLPNGPFITRGHYKTLTHIDDILGNQ